MTNSNCNEFDTIKNFKPMPKRFMVWSVKLGKFLTAREAHEFLFYKFVKTEPSGVCELKSTDRHIIVQSTNLFDKDGNEIFEGSIISLEGYEEDGMTLRSNYTIYGYVYNKDGRYYLKVYEDGRLINDEYEISEALEDDSSMVVGHILSNPELVEEKK